MKVIPTIFAHNKKEFNVRKQKKFKKIALCAPPFVAIILDERKRIQVVRLGRATVESGRRGLPAESSANLRLLKPGGIVFQMSSLGNGPSGNGRTDRGA